MFRADAVGPQDPFPPYRWSDVDAQLARNLGLPFIRPIDLFGGKTDPVPSLTREIAIMVGNPGSGKTTGAKILEIGGYVRCSRDEIKKNATAQDIHKCFLTALNGYPGKSVVVDATNPSYQRTLAGNIEGGRKFYEDEARARGIPVRILWYVRDGRAFNALRPNPCLEWLIQDHMVILLTSNDLHQPKEQSRYFTEQFPSYDGNILRQLHPDFQNRELFDHGYYLISR